MLATLTDALRKQHFCTPQQRFVAVTATTGIAASLVNGVTLHSWAGCGLAKRSAELLAKRLEGTEAYARWLHTKVLIVDEGQHFRRMDFMCKAKTNWPPVSMLNGQLFAVSVGVDLLSVPPMLKLRHFRAMHRNSNISPV